MDPLSLAASVIAVVGAVNSVGHRTLQKLKSIRNAPDALFALNNEVSDLQLILDEVSVILRQNDGSIHTSTCSHIAINLDLAKERFLELEKIIEYQVMRVGPNNQPTVNNLGWVRYEGKIQKIQQDLRRIRKNLEAYLKILTPSTVVKLRLNIQQLHYMVEDMQSWQQTNQANVIQAVNQHQKSIECALSDIIRTHAVRPEIPHTVPGHLRITSEHDIQPLSSEDTSHSENNSANIPYSQMVKVSATRLKEISAICECHCHRQHRFQSSRMFEIALGQVFLGYTGLPIISPSCNLTSCNHSVTPMFWVDYYFPSWFFSWKIYLEVRKRKNCGPEQILRISRVVPSTCTLIRSAMQGDTTRVKSILQNGLGSPFDTDGLNTPLILAVQAGHVDICQVLLHAGANPYEENCLQNAYDYAWDTILSNQGDAHTTVRLKEIFSNLNSLERRQFSLLHKLVIGYSTKLDLSSFTSILKDMARSSINEGDAYGQTALCWAAIRGDVEYTYLLLQNGADPNVTPSKGPTPLQSATESGSYGCMEVLLQAGAKVDFQGASRMAALHIAVVKHDNVDLVRLLLQYGANIVYPSGENALFTAAWANDAELIRLLLEKGVDYRLRVRMFGTILHGAARFCSLEIIEVLIEANLEGLDTEDLFEGSTALEMAKRRVDMSPQWIDTFGKLVEKIKVAKVAAHESVSSNKKEENH